MKTNFMKSAVLAASLFGALGSASAETMHARIPFGFSAAGNSMPAGAYVIRTLPNASSVLLFENEETKAQTMVFARTIAAERVKSAKPLMFTAGSEEKELATIASDGRSYELNVRSTKPLLKGVALTLTSGGK